MVAGAIDRRFHFQKRVDGVNNGMGTTKQGWATQFTAYASVTPLRGSETVQAARIEGRQPVIVTFRKSSESALVDHAWRIVDINTSKKFNLKAGAITENRGLYEFMAESGGVDG